MSSRPAHFRKGQETDHARQVQVPPQVHQATPMRSRSISAPLLLFSRIRSRRGDRKPRRATGISLCAVSWIVENQLNIFLEKTNRFRQEGICGVKSSICEPRMRDGFCTSVGHPQRKDSFFSRVTEEHFDVCWNIRTDQRTKALRRDRRCFDFEELSRQADLSP